MATESEAKKRYRKSVKGKAVFKRSQAKYRIKIRSLTIKELGGYCVKCGFSDIRALQVDHINGNGRKERQTSIRNAYMLFKDIIEDPEKYQLLCANCNVIKRVENKEN